MEQGGGEAVRAYAVRAGGMLVGSSHSHCSGI